MDGYKKMLEEQGNKCLACDEFHDLVVDHDHATGKIRGLLCKKCNTGLGHFRDNPEALERAAEYLRRHRGQ